MVVDDVDGVDDVDDVDDDDDSVDPVMEIVDGNVTFSDIVLLESVMVVFVSKYIALDGVNNCWVSVVEDGSREWVACSALVTENV